MAETSKRQAILERMRKALAVSEDDEARRAVVARRIKEHRPNLIPDRAQVEHAQQVDLFCAQAEAVQSTVARVDTPADIPSEIADYLRNNNLPQSLRHGADPLITGLPWQDKTPSLEVHTGPAEPTDEVSLSHAVAGVAETGTLVLTSGSDNPTTLNFLPENHIVVMRAADITGSYEDAWQGLRQQYGERVLPRTVNLITGPSRTGDIEQRIELGAHGPRRLHIIVIGD